MCCYVRNARARLPLGKGWWTKKHLCKRQLAAALDSWRAIKSRRSHCGDGGGRSVTPTQPVSPSSSQPTKPRGDPRRYELLLRALVQDANCPHQEKKAPHEAGLSVRARRGSREAYIMPSMPPWPCGAPPAFLLLLRRLGDHRLGRQQETRDGRRVLQRQARDLGRVDDAELHHVAVLAVRGVEAVVALAVDDGVEHDGRVARRRCRRSGAAALRRPCARC